MSKAKSAKVAAAPVTTAAKKTKQQPAEKVAEDKLNSGDIPMLLLQERKERAERNGWTFEQDADGMLSATKPAGEFCGTHSSVFALLNQIEGEDSGDHSTVFDILKLLSPPAPPFDVEAYENALIQSGSDYDPEDEDNNYTPAEVRVNYFYDALKTALYIRETESLLPNLKPKELKKAETDLQIKTGSLTGCLVNTHNFFGKESAEYLRGKFALFGFFFDDDYKLIENDENYRLAVITTAPEPGETALAGNVPETADAAIEIQNELVLDKFQQLIRDVVSGAEDQKEIENRFEKDLGSEWFLTFADESNEEFQERVLNIHAKLVAARSEPLQQFAAPSPGQYREISRLLIHPSATNPRKDFGSDDLSELAASIRQHGIQQPIIVRPLKAVPQDIAEKYTNLIKAKRAAKQTQDEAQVAASADGTDTNSKIYARALEKYASAERALSSHLEKDLAGYGYELIAGERRWRASGIAGLDEIPCIVRDASDREAFEIQIIENLQRKDIEPMQEAAGFKNLLDNGNFTVADISLSVGKPPAFVHQRLKLNDLIEAGQKDLAKGKLPIGHAMEIAKYAPDIQQELLKEVFDWYGTVKSLTSLKQLIESRVFKLLKRAPFSLKATNLRADGLACVVCPERSGANPTLFEIVKPEDDACLNKQCFAAKTQIHIQIKRQESSAKMREKSGDKNYLAPVIINSYGSSDVFPDALNLDQYKRISDKKNKCDSAEEAIYVDTEKFAHSQLICRAGQCQVHFPAGVTRAEKKNEQEAQKRLDRKEELFDYRTAKRVSPRVFREAMVKFDGLLFDDLNLLAELVARFWKLQVYESSDVMNIILGIVSEWTDEEIDGYYREEADRVNAVKKLTVEHQFHFLFLLLNAYKGAMFYENYLSQKEVRELAEKYEINYRLLDAEERHALCIEPKSQYRKHAEIFKKYMDDVRAGKKRETAARVCAGLSSEGLKRCRQTKQKIWKPICLKRSAAPTAGGRTKL